MKAVSLLGSLLGSAQERRRDYEDLYERHARLNSDDRAVGNGDFDAIGRIELEVLLMEGLQPGQTLADFGCGNGRLAVHAIPALVGGHYIGIDISETFLARASERIGKVVPVPPCRIAWLHQNSPSFPLLDHSVDMMCAFSVFTHMEHEDSYQYLKEALRVVRPGAKFIFSCLPMNLGASRNIFLAEAAMDLQARWGRVRNVTTTVEMMTEIARMAGWNPLRWYSGDEPNIGLRGGEMHCFGQSCCVLEAPAAA